MNQLIVQNDFVSLPSQCTDDETGDYAGDIDIPSKDTSYPEQKTTECTKFSKKNK